MLSIRKAMNLISEYELCLNYMTKCYSMSLEYKVDVIEMFHSQIHRTNAIVLSIVTRKSKIY